MITMLISPTLNVSCSENVLLKISSYFGVSHEQAYRKGVDSLLKLTEMVIANNEHSEIIKLFLCDCHLRTSINLDDISDMPTQLIGDCLNVIVLRYAFVV
ncbi:hypothetical protein M1S17_18275 [Acinetobacter baumannii]|uniref:hypothetical protein n=1 Tax=Acinetobacter baumannii TaxID=470 RepID=UPI002016C41A|nr:hypothetical protein [Acinetobacter baumannii]UQM29249.1 hypothetical protein M1S17_18275 [Acinetobacter baumannii]